MACDRDDGKARGGQDDDRTNEFEAHGEPSICADGREVGSQVSIYAPLILQFEALLLVVSADGAHAAKRLLEVCIDRATADAVKALELARGSEIVSLDVQVERAKRDDERDENGRGNRYDHQGKAGWRDQSAVRREVHGGAYLSLN